MVINMKVLYAILSALLSLILSFTSSLGEGADHMIKPTDAKNIRMCFATASDTHITDSSVRYTQLKQGLADMTYDTDIVDAVVFAGDLTDHGEKAQFDYLFEAFDEACKTENIILATGNHDTWSDDGSVAGMKYFVDGYNALTGRNIEKPYYTTVVNGYTFITLASEGDHVYATISQEQIDWFAAEMTKASLSGLPIFVVCHFPINGTNGQAELWDEGGIGEQSDAINAILLKHSNVFYISGHLHAGFTGGLIDAGPDYTIESNGSVHYINLPCFTYLNTEAGNPLSGCGYVFEVYDDYVLLRSRDYVMTGWLDLHDARIDLVTAQAAS